MLFSPSATNRSGKLLLLVAHQSPYPPKPFEYYELKKVCTPILGRNG